MSMLINRYKGFPYPTVDCSGEPSLTTQADAKDLDINKIVARVMKGQTIPVLNGEPFYGDVSEFDGLQDAIMKVQQAEDLFMQYPAELRERFENDPVKMVEFLENKDNLDEAIKLGLANKKKKEDAEGASTPNPVSG